MDGTAARLFRQSYLNGYFAPRTWVFWRTLIVCFCLCCLVGHWFEMPYCWAMDSLFGIVDETYAVLSDPWYVPYWVYGFGAVAMTLAIEPLKERIVSHRKTAWGAVLETFAIAMFLAMALELLFGLICNQPDANGVYPYWDNSKLPLNVFGQAWLVNDFFIGLVAVGYLWVVFPLVRKVSVKLRPFLSNVLFGLAVAGFAACCAFAYLPALA